MIGPFCFYTKISDNSSILPDSAIFLNIATIFDTVFSLTVMQVWASPKAQFITESRMLTLREENLTFKEGGIMIIFPDG